MPSYATAGTEMIRIKALREAKGLNTRRDPSTIRPADAGIGDNFIQVKDSRTSRFKQAKFFGTPDAKKGKDGWIRYEGGAEAVFFSSTTTFV